MLRVAFAWVSVLGIAVAGCSSVPYTAPTPTPLNLNGTWSGTASVTQANNVVSVPIKWVTSQNGTALTGPFTIVTPTGVVIGGTANGTISGSEVAFTMFLPPGSYAALGSSGCTANVTGTLPATATTLSGPVTYTYNQTCVDAGLVTVLTEMQQFSMTKPISLPMSVIAAVDAQKSTRF
jgi:hypothetical protein